MEAENACLRAERQRLLERLAVYGVALATTDEKKTDVLQRLFNVLDTNSRGELDATGLRQLVWLLGEDLSVSEAQACIARLDFDSSGGLSFSELCDWWLAYPDNNKQTSASADGSVGHTTGGPLVEDALLSTLQHRLHSNSYVQMLVGWKEKWKRLLTAPPVDDDHTFRLTLHAEVGDFGEARSGASVNFSQDPDTAAAARKELKAPSNCVGFVSFAFTVRSGFDEFELGELAGSLANLLLLAKPLFKFHSHKTAMGKHNSTGERTMVLSLFWSDIDKLVQLRSALIGMDLKELDGTIELSQKPGDETEEFVMGRMQGKLTMGINMVPFFNELLNQYKSDAYRAKVNLLATFRDLDLRVKLDNMEEAYRRFSAGIDVLRDVRGLNSLKQLLMPFVVATYQNNSVPAPIKETYFKALHTLLGVSSIHLQMDEQLLRFAFHNADIAALLPTKDELAAWRPPAPVSAPPHRDLRPLFDSSLYRLAVVGPPGVGKTTLIERYVWPSLDPTIGIPQRTVVLNGATALVQISDSPPFQLPNWVQEMHAVVLVYSVTDRSSFEALNKLRERLLQLNTLPIMLLANKSDQSEQRQVKTQEGEELALKWDNCLFCEISAHDEASLESAFLELLHDLQTPRRESPLPWYALAHQN